VKIKRDSIKRFFGECAAVITGSVLFSMSLNMFLLPSKIVLGGMTGIATVLNLFFGAPVGITIIILNIPLIIANTFFFGKGFLRRTVIGVITTSLASDILTVFPITETDPLLCSILGGLSMGAAVGILIARGYTTGGTDLVACLVKLKWKGASTGTLVMMCDLVIIVGAALVTENISGLFYSVICTWISGRVLDVILSGARQAGQAFIITSKPDETVALILKRLDRGVTVLHGEGGYTGEERRVIMCAVPKRELFYLKELVAECDPGAFLVIADATEVTGKGFVSRAAGEMRHK